MAKFRGREIGRIPFWLSVFVVEKKKGTAKRIKDRASEEKGERLATGWGFGLHPAAGLLAKPAPSPLSLLLPKQSKKKKKKTEK